MDITDELERCLRTDNPIFIGCIRRNEWTKGEVVPYRFYRGNSLLALVGQRTKIAYPPGFFDAWVREKGDGGYDVLTFRGGPYKPYWDEDCRLLAACVAAYTALQIDGCMLLHEFDNTLRVRYFGLPADYKCLVEQQVEAWKAGTPEEPTRLGKHTRRAYSYCYNCPVLDKCDALDLIKGDTGDWPQQKRKGK